MKFKLRREDRTDAYGRGIDPNWDETEQIDIQTKRYRKGYEEYFEGYTEKEELNRFGKKVAVRVYTGTLFIPKLSDSQRIRTKALYTFLLVMAIVLNVWALCLPVWSNYNVWTFIFGCAPAVVYVRMLFPLGAYIMAGPELKLFEYNKGSRLLAVIAKPAFIAAGASVLSVPVVLLIFHAPFKLAELLRMAMIAMSAFLAAYIELCEKKIEYDTIENK